MYIADLHIHSKYSRATSRECVPEYLDLWARRKGIDLIGTGDFTHPAWREELREKLIPAEDGFFTLKEEYRLRDDAVPGASRPRFVVTGEISSIYKKNGRVRKVHNLILLPGLEEAALLAKRLEAIGNLHSDGRPILGLDSRDLLEITLEACPEAVFIPAHIWTPHFSLFGAFSGFDTIEECFEDLTPHIRALETGLSSDPPMNWRLSALDRFTLVSNSDAHSPSKLGREANLFNTELSYGAMVRALREGSDGDPNTRSFSGTIEFFPEEGKYHYDGHRACKQCLTPIQAEEHSGLCPVCGGKLTIGVLHRVEQLADREEGFLLPAARPFESLVPLPEVIAASTGFGAACGKVRTRYEALLTDLGSEFHILRTAPLEDIKRLAGPCVAEGIRRMREGQVELSPGYDGEYGKVKLLDEKEIEVLSGQLCFFGENPAKKKPEAAPRKKSRKAAAAEAASVPAETLNEQQQNAVNAPEPNIAVIAGPGTGKTRTLVAKIIALLEAGAKPSQITAVTFTNKAAKEMRQRLDAQFGRRAHSVNIGTFHGVCLGLLSKRGPVTVIDGYEARAMAEDVAETLSLKLPPKKLLEAVSRQKNGIFPDTETVPPEAVALYCERLKNSSVRDYDDLLLEALALFETGGADKKDRAAFRYLLVDEFQDINDLQYRLLQAWGKESAGLFVIGDPDQSIYGFRGAAPDCFSRFQADFGGHEIRLTQNYRSTPEILSCALSVISHNGGARTLTPWRKPGVPVRLLTSADDFSEAVFVAKEINRMVGGIDMLDAHSHPANRGFSDFAVLYRTRRQAEVLEKCLAIEGIPYVVAGRDDILADPGVRGTVCFFRWLLNRDDAVSRRTCQKLLPAWQTLAQAYDDRVKKEKPHKLLESWTADTGLAGHAIDRLLGMAVFQNDMPSFLQNLVMGQDSDVARSGNKLYTSDAVLLTTLHGAKGLEFPVVFLCGLNKGILPLETSGCGRQEERRLFYVGMTRAREELVLLTSREPSSPFLEELPREALITGGTVELKRPPEIRQLSLFL